MSKVTTASTAATAAATSAIVILDTQYIKSLLMLKLVPPECSATYYYITEHVEVLLNHLVCKTKYMCVLCAYRV
jgi:hypothetical protein